MQINLTKDFLRLLCVGAFVVASTLALGACTSERELVLSEVEKTEVEAQARLDEVAPKQGIRTPLEIRDEPWYGSKAITIQNGAPLPGSFLRDDGVVVTFDRPLSLRQTANLIQAATGIRIITGRASAALVSSHVSDGSDSFLPVGGYEVSGGRIVWQGRLDTLLNQVADAFDAEWRYDRGVINISEEVTRTFMLHALSSEITSDGKLETGDQESDSTLPELGIDETTELKIWEEMETSITSIVGDFGRVTFSPTTGTITASGPPSIVRNVEEYLRLQNALRLRRVAIGLKVLEVTLDRRYALDFDLDVLIEHAIKDRPFQYNSVGTGFNAGILSAAPTGTDNDAVEMLVNALDDDNSYRRISVVHTAAVVTLSDQPAPLQVGRQVSYIESVSATTDSGSGSTSITPGTVNLGLTMTVLPRVIERDRVMMRIGIGITDASQPFRTAETGDAGLSVELPEVETTGFLQNAVLSSGETLVLAGFERRERSSQETGLGGGWLTGGGEATVRGRTVTILLLTTEILPEDPLTILGGTTR